ncbi:MAG: hypothetical protein LBT25_07325 [Candidatus Symbiothrix sp.]|jgi:flagellin-specific chaperone FliS|nr:hypothetical protein [Candidatus Symbiothrix sp.]
MKNIVGSIVEKENFFGREKEINRAWELLENGNSLILAAPRRVGKSSFAKKMKDKAEIEGWKGYYIDLEKSKTETDFIKRFLTVLKGEKWFEKFKVDNFKVSVPYVSFDISKNEDICQKIEQALPYSEDTLIVIDELTIFLDNLHEDNKKNDLDNVEFVLNWLRGLRQVSGNKIRWIFCSSIGIENFASAHNLSYTLNDVTSFAIDELKGNEPTLFIKELAESKKLTFQDDVIQYLLNKLGWKLPYFIQLLFKEIVDFTESEKEISIDTIDKAYAHTISKNSIHFNTWFERLNEYKEDKQYALILLKELSRMKAGKSRNSLQSLIVEKVLDVDKAEEILNRILFLLDKEGYIMESAGKYTFRSPFLRDFWYNRFVL